MGLLPLSPHEYDDFLIFSHGSGTTVVVVPVAEEERSL